MAPIARRELIQWIRSRADRSGSFRDEVRLLARSLENLARADAEAPASLGAEVQALVSDANALRNEFLVAINEVAESDRELLAEAMAQLLEAHAAVGEDRTLRFSTVQNLLRTLVERPYLGRLPFAQAMCGLELADSESVPHLQLAARARPQLDRPTLVLAGRDLAEWMARQGDHEGALRILGGILQHVPNVDAAFDAACVAASMGNRAELRRHVEAVLAERPILLAELLAARVLRANVGDVAEIAVRLQVKGRQEVRRALSEANRAIGRAKQASKMAEVEVPEASALPEEAIDRADLLSLPDLITMASQVAKQYCDRVDRDLDAEAARRHRRLAQARTALDEAREARDEAVERAGQAKSEGMSRAEALLSRTAWEAERAQQGCVLSALLTGGILGTSALLVELLARAGAKVEVGSTYMPITAAVAVVPPSIAMLLLCAASFRRYRLEGQYNLAIAEAAGNYESAVRAADERYRAAVEIHDPVISEAEMGVRRVEEGQRILRSAIRAA